MATTVPGGFSAVTGLQESRGRIIATMKKNDTGYKVGQ